MITKGSDLMLMMAILGLLKIWNVKTRSCIRSIECGYALCCAFLPGNRHVSSCIPCEWVVICGLLIIYPMMD